MTITTPKLIKEMVNRFLMRKLPEHFSPDCFVTFDKDRAVASKCWPTGTNLLSAEQAQELFENVAVPLTLRIQELEAENAKLKAPVKDVQTRLIGTQLPKYRCHKEVWGVKIAKLEYKTSESGKLYVVMTPAEEGYGPRELSGNFVVKHQPEVGGYYVIYEDGYESFSPAKAFENGYTRI